MPIPYWRLSSYYFFYFATLGCFIPYWNLYLKDIGFNTVQIGALSALLAGTRIIAPNLWGWIADHTGKRLRSIRLAAFFATLIYTGFLFVHGYVWFTWITIGFSFFWNAALPQFEAATLAHLKTQPYRYSQIRLWGSIGFIVAVLGGGWLLDINLSTLPPQIWSNSSFINWISSLKPIALLPGIVLSLFFMQWLITLIVPDAHTASYSTERIGILQVLKKRGVLAFFVVCMLLQFAHAPYYVFYSIYLKQLHYSATITGGLWALGVVAEIVLFVFMRQVLQRFPLKTILLCSIVLAIVRWLAIAWCAQYLWALLVAQLLHAMTFGATHITAIHFVHEYFGDQHQGKGQALYNSLGMGLGGMLGSLFSGYFWDLWGATGIFSIAALSCAIALLITSIWIGSDR